MGNGGGEEVTAHNTPNPSPRRTKTPHKLDDLRTLNYLQRATLKLISPSHTMRTTKTRYSSALTTPLKCMHHNLKDQAFWIASEDNPADGPSRQELRKIMEEEGASAAAIDWRSIPTDALDPLEDPRKYLGSHHGIDAYPEGRIMGNLGSCLRWRVPKVRGKRLSESSHWPNKVTIYSCLIVDPPDWRQSCDITRNDYVIGKIQVAKVNDLAVSRSRSIPVSTRLVDQPDWRQGCDITLNDYVIGKTQVAKVNDLTVSRSRSISSRQNGARSDGNILAPGMSHPENPRRKCCDITRNDYVTAKLEHGQRGQEVGRGSNMPGGGREGAGGEGETNS
uniref:Uncharacterized protein n=1 Tax=Timema shepardi TaxID=629360 RepID=A0A7R9B234_TIMSH|nr:unnamed protein product [Timema shepardi]